MAHKQEENDQLSRKKWSVKLTSNPTVTRSGAPLRHRVEPLPKQLALNPKLTRTGFSLTSHEEKRRLEGAAPLRAKGKQRIPKSRRGG